MAKPTEEKIIGEENLETGTLEFGETSPEGTRFESFTPNAPITSDSLTPAPTIDFQEPQPETTFPVADLPTVEPLALTKPEEEASGLSKELRDISKGLVGESAERARLETERGLPELEATQTDLSGQLSALQAEAKAIPLQIQEEFKGRGVTGAGIRPIQTSRLRQNAIKALTVSSLLEASRGNIALAQSQVDRAVAQKYDPIREDIAVKRANLQLIKESPEFSLADKNRADKQIAQQNKREKAIAEQEAEELAIKSLAVQAAQSGADAQTLRDIQNAPNEVIANRIAASAGVFRAVGDQFTLSPGQTRFDSQGRIVAIGSADGDIKTKSIGNEIVKINPDGSTEVIFRGKETDDPFTVQQTFQNTMSLRNKFLDESKDFKKVRDSWGRIQASAEDPSAAGDLALIFNYMKTLDPGSVVRESEFKTAAEAGSFLDRTYGFGLKLKEGQRLAPDQRADFVDRAEKLFNAQVKVQQDRQNENQSTAGQFGLDARLSTPDLIPVVPKFKDINDFIDNAPEEQIQLFDEIQQETGIDDNELIDLINEQFSEAPTFSQVGGDTKTATGNINTFTIAGKKITADETVENLLKKADELMFKETGEHIKINQSFRSKEQQAELFRRSQAGEIGRAAPPGMSFHEKGLAIDVSNWREAEKFLRLVGLKNNLADDKGHFSFGEFT